MYNLGGKDVTGKALATEVARAIGPGGYADPHRLYAPMRRLRDRGLVTTVTSDVGKTLRHSLTEDGVKSAFHESPNVAEWKKRRRLGESVGAIAATVGHPVGTVRRALGSIPKRPKAERRQLAMPNRNWATVYREKRGIRPAAESVGVSYGTMRNALRALGVLNERKRTDSTR
jgi:hypothetical protein